MSITELVEITVGDSIDQLRHPIACMRWPESRAFRTSPRPGGCSLRGWMLDAARSTGCSARSPLPPRSSWPRSARLAGALIGWVGEWRVQLLVLPADDLAASAADEAGVSALVDVAATAVRERQTTAHTQRRTDRELVQAERDAVAAQRDLPPPTPYTRTESRDGRAHRAPLIHRVRSPHRCPRGRHSGRLHSVRGASVRLRGHPIGWALPGVVSDGDRRPGRIIGSGPQPSQQWDSRRPGQGTIRPGCRVTARIRLVPVLPADLWWR